MRICFQKILYCNKKMRYCSKTSNTTNTTAESNNKKLKVVTKIINVINHNFENVLKARHNALFRSLVRKNLIISCPKIYFPFNFPYRSSYKFKFFKFHYSGQRFYVFTFLISCLTAASDLTAAFRTIVDLELF